MLNIKKMGYISVGGVFVFTLLYTIYTYACQLPNDKSSSYMVEGIITDINKPYSSFSLFNGQEKIDFVLEPGAKVNRNGMKSGKDELNNSDHVKLITNSKHQVSYVQATASNLQQDEVESKSSKSYEMKEAGPTDTTTKDTGQNPVLIENRYSLNIKELYLLVDYGSGIQYEMKYHRNNQGNVNSSIHKKTRDENIRARDNESTALIEMFINQLALNSESSQEQVSTQIQQILGIANGNFRELEFKAEFTNGKQIDFHEKGKGLNSKLVN